MERLRRARQGSWLPVCHHERSHPREGRCSHPARAASRPDFSRRQLRRDRRRRIPRQPRRQSRLPSARIRTSGRHVHLRSRNRLVRQLPEPHGDRHRPRRHRSRRQRRVERQCPPPTSGRRHGSLAQQTMPPSSISLSFYAARKPSPAFSSPVDSPIPQPPTPSSVPPSMISSIPCSCSAWTSPSLASSKQFAPANPSLSTVTTTLTAPRPPSSSKRPSSASPPKRPRRGSPTTSRTVSAKATACKPESSEKLLPQASASSSASTPASGPSQRQKKPRPSAWISSSRTIIFPTVLSGSPTQLQF